MSSKYPSITETFTSDPIFTAATLSTYCTPPANLALAAANFVAAGSDLYPRFGAGARFGGFALNDIPKITGVGLWCNIADGLVSIDNPDTYLTGLTILLTFNGYNAAGVLTQANFTLDVLQFKLQVFNQIQEVSYIPNFSALSYSALGGPGSPTPGHYRINAKLAATTMSFSTISVDPLYAALPIYIRPFVVIEHTFPMFAGF